MAPLTESLPVRVAVYVAACGGGVGVDVTPEPKLAPELEPPQPNNPRPDD